jgi:TolB protein
MAALALAMRGTVASAQDSSAVRLTLRWTPGTKPGLLMLPVNGESGDSIRAIMQRDLDFGDRVNVISGDVIVADTGSDASRGEFNYPLYSRLGALVMVQATVTDTGLHVAVHNVGTQRVERVKDFPLSAPPLSPQWRQQVHVASDAVEFWVTNIPGIAATRVLYTSDGRVWQIDSDGANPTPLTPVSPPAAPAAYPAWHPAATHITYTVMTEEGRRVAIKEMGGAARTIPAPSGSVNTSPIFSPDGNTLLYAFGQESGTEIYARSAFGSDDARRRVTVSQGRDAMSPSYSPDGRRIVYVSNRPGHPELYTADADGTNSELLTPFNFGDQSQRTDPAWSPDGQLIAFQAEKDGSSQLHTVNPRSRQIRQYTSNGRNEDPSWAPDSRHVVFTSNRSGSWQLWVLDIESGRTRQLTRAASGARGGAWSPRLNVQ